MKEKFGPFKLIDDKGHGSNATVYRAQLKDQIVAIKIFERGRNSEDYEWIKHFFDREISIIKKLQHPNIIKILKTGIIDETPYISMQFMEGGSLDYKLKDVDFFSVTETLSVLKPIASATLDGIQPNGPIEITPQESWRISRRPKPTVRIPSPVRFSLIRC